MIHDKKNQDLRMPAFYTLGVPGNARKNKAHETPEMAQGGITMKKYVSFILALMLILGMAACGTQATGSPTPSEPAPKQAQWHQQSPQPSHRNQQRKSQITTLAIPH
jgi:hypothetical protein